MAGVVVEDCFGKWRGLAGACKEQLMQLFKFCVLGCCCLNAMVFEFDRQTITSLDEYNDTVGLVLTQEFEVGAVVEETMVVFCLSCLMMFLMVSKFE